MRAGPVSRVQLEKYRRTLEQGQHTLISGPTGSGKTELAGKLLNAQADRGAFVVAFICKLRPDKTLLKSYSDWTRWTDWKKNPRPYERKILLWPKVENIPAREALAIQKDVFRRALDAITATGHWSVYFDEGLHMCSPSFVNMGNDIAMAHALGRSSGLSLMTATQRPAHLPLILYGSASHVFVANTSEEADLKRLSNLDSKHSRRTIEPVITQLPKHNFLWIAAREDSPPEVVDLAK